MLIHNIFKINPMQVGHPVNKKIPSVIREETKRTKHVLPHPQSSKNNPTIIRLTHFMLTDKGVNKPL